MSDHFLTWEDGQGTIRNTIQKRIGAEKGVKLYQIDGENRGTYIQVKVGLYLEDKMQYGGVVDIASEFHLKPVFRHSELMNEVDEICEQIKEARRQAGISILYKPKNFRNPLKGTGLRGHWKKDNATIQ